jgi:hypothetical protein
MRTTNSVCAGICTAGAGAGAAAEASGVARRNTGLSLSPGDAAEEDDDGRCNVGAPLSGDEDEDADESDEDELDEDRFNVGRESSEGYEDPEDPEEGYEPVSFGSGWRITGREPVVREPEPELESELEDELDPESESARRRVGRPSSRGVSREPSRELVYPPLLNSMRAISATSMVWMLSPTSTLIWRGVPPR